MSRLPGRGAGRSGGVRPAVATIDDIAAIAEFLNTTVIIHPLVLARVLALKEYMGSAAIHRVFAPVPFPSSQ
jgi:hypothetical protein